MPPPENGLTCPAASPTSSALSSNDRGANVSGIVPPYIRHGSMLAKSAGNACASRR